MYQCDTGTVSLKEKDWVEDIDNIALSSLRRIVGVVNQEVSLLNETVSEVIRGGDHSLSEDNIQKAAIRADAHDFIQTLPNGYDTVVGERGTLLSGGQRQRILIAQIMARQTPILILDEATSALDTLSEKRVYEALIEKMNECLIILITHRLGSLESFGQIHVLDNGHVAESGNWEDLMTKKGALYNMTHSERPGPAS